MSLRNRFHESMRGIAHAKPAPESLPVNDSSWTIPVYSVAVTRHPLAHALRLRKHLPPVEIGRKVKEMKPPNSRGRQLMQHLRGVGWVNAFDLPDSPKILANLIGKGWVESQLTENCTVYRLTDLGLEAKKAPLRIK
jgi:hypothetical protein